MTLFKRKQKQISPIFKQVKEFKYLGITISSSGKVNNHIKQAQQRMEKTATTIKQIKSHLIPLSIKKEIFQIYLTPIFRYMISTLKHAPKTTLLNQCQLISKTLKEALSLPLSYSTRKLYLALNLQHPLDIVRDSIERVNKKLTKNNIQINDVNTLESFAKNSLVAQ